MADLGEQLESYTETPYFLFNPDRSDMRQADRNASVQDITTYIYQSLIDFQGKWEASDRTVWIITMPNARYLKAGDKIKNITTSEVYTIESVLDKYTKLIRLTTGTTAPASGDVLELTNDNMVNFVSGYPMEYKEKTTWDDWVDTVTFRVKRKEPGTIGKHPFDPPTEIKPRVREERIDPDYDDCHIQILGQWFDVLIQFDCWAKTNNRCDDLIEWFEDFVYKYTWVWKKNGVNEILYWMRTPDEEISKWRNDLAFRSVLYYFRTEKLVTIREHDFKQIDLYLELSNTVPSGFYGAGYDEIAASGLTEVIDLGFEETYT